MGGDEQWRWVTEQSAANKNLIAELYDRTDASYTGSVPMVGFGAGAYVLALWQRGPVAPTQGDGPAADRDAGLGAPASPGGCCDANTSGPRAPILPMTIALGALRRRSRSGRGPRPEARGPRAQRERSASATA